MKKTAVLLILSWIQYIYSPVSAQVFQGTPPAEWIEVSGEASIKLPQEEKLEHQELLRLAQQTAIENQFGTSIVYGNFMKTYESELQHYEHFVDMKSQFAQGAIPKESNTIIQICFILIRSKFKSFYIKNKERE